MGVDNVSQSPDVIKKKQATFAISRDIKLTKIAEKWNYTFVENTDANHAYFQCNKGHLFCITTQYLYIRNNANDCICNKCNPYKKGFSKDEKLIVSFIKENYSGRVRENSYNVIKKYEIDICVPEHNFAIEYNGLHFHSENGRPKNYHLNKTELCEDADITLLHVWEDDWQRRKDKVKCVINRLLKKSNNDYKMTNIKENEDSDDEIINTFLKCNALKYIKKWSCSLGVYDGEDLMAVFCFDKSNNRQWNIVNICFRRDLSLKSDIFNEVIQKFRNLYNLPLIVEIDVSTELYYSGMLLETGFKFVKRTNIDYCWSKNQKRFAKEKLNKKALIKNGYYDDKLSIDNNVRNLGFEKVWNCGYDVYGFNI